MECGFLILYETLPDDWMAEGGGFEPSGAIHPAAFEAAALPLC